MSKIRTTNACSHCSLPIRHRKANCCSTLTTSWKAVRRLTARPWRDSLTSTVVVRRSTSCRQDKRVHGSPGDVSCKNPDFRITMSMDEYVKSKLRLVEVPKGYLSNTKEISDGMLTNIKGVNGGLGWLASTGRPDMAAPHSIIPSVSDQRSLQLISEVNAAVKQCHAGPITITIWPIPFAELRWTTFTDSGFRHGGATATPTRLVGVCHQQVLQPRTVGACECASLAESEAHTKSGESTTCRDICSKLSSGGDDLDQSIVGINDLERF